MKYHFVKKARTPILTDIGKEKLSNNETLLDSDYLVLKGQSYYWWKFRNRSKQISLTEPTSSQLDKYGKSEWQEKWEEFENRVNDCANVEGLEDDASDLSSEIEEYRDELQSRLDNMPESLQESSVLNERIEELDGLIDQLAS